MSLFENIVTDKLSCVRYANAVVTNNMLQFEITKKLCPLSWDVLHVKLSENNVKTLHQRSGGKYCQNMFLSKINLEFIEIK